MNILTKILLFSIAAAVIAGCSWIKPAPQPVVTQPVLVHDIEVRYVPIDPRLTRPTDALPSATTFGDLWSRDKAADAAKAEADARFACIASVQGTLVSDPVPDCAK